MAVYDYSDYKIYLKEWVENQPRAGRGLIRKIAEHLNMSSPMVSHILSGNKHFSFEAANDLCQFLNLDDGETEYFFLLLSHAKAGSFSLQERLKRKIRIEQKKAAQFTKRVKIDQELPDVDKMTFYSNWLYSGIRNMTACPDFQNIDQIAKHLNISRILAQKVIDFLVKSNLCLEKNGKLEPGPQHTHIEFKSPLVGKHHQNWRLQGFEKMIEVDERNFFFTAPMSLSVETAELIRQKLPSFIDEILKHVKPSPSEVVYCLNMDWFKY
jgi:uncharacterized protein (TIGR02147 family)